MNSEVTGVRRRMFLAREAAKLTRTAAAKELGVTRYMLGRWEQGTSHPAPEQVGEMCILYGVMPCYLILGRGDLPGVVAAAMRAASPAGGVPS